MTMLEIERKFLVDVNKLPGCLQPVHIAQGYLCDDPKRTVRVRVADLKGYMTVKGLSSPNGLSRFEWEKEIPFNEAMMLLNMCDYRLHKDRYVMVVAGKTWEIDVFRDFHEGLVIAEIELNSEDEEFVRPDWLLAEVTGHKQYYNSHLIKCKKEWWK